MDVTKEFYPVGIGKHIVCIYAVLTAAAYKQLVGASPEPQLFYSGVTRRKRG